MENNLGKVNEVTDKAPNKKIKKILTTLSAYHLLFCPVHGIPANILRVLGATEVSRRLFSSADGQNMISTISNTIHDYEYDVVVHIVAKVYEILGHEVVRPSVTAFHFGQKLLKTHIHEHANQFTHEVNNTTEIVMQGLFSLSLYYIIHRLYHSKKFRSAIFKLLPEVDK